MKTQIFNSKSLKNMACSIAMLGFFIFQHDAQAADPCLSPANSIVAENCRGGNPSSEWDVESAGDTSIQGFATDISVNRGQNISFKINTNASSYSIDIYRIGYYGGMGARKVAEILPSAVLPKIQQPCLSDVATGLVDCGNWTVSATWSVPAEATSGIYIARLKRTDNGGASHIIFIVRNDSSNSNLLFQTSDTTWQAYNDYGGNSLYVGSPVGRAYKVSYNRPLNTRGNQFSRAGFFGAEYPMVRWLEANGYDISYTSGVDTDRRGAELLEHNVFLSVGHDEYWSAGQRANVEAARNAGVNLAFFSGNEVFWKTRWENSIDGSGTTHRTLVSYKETKANAKIDPLANIWTGTWRDPRFSPPADGGRPENALTGTIFTVNCCLDGVSLNVPQEYSNLRFWRNTSIAALLPGQTATLPAGVLGYEFDEALDNGFSPGGLIKLSKTVINLAGELYLLDYGNAYGAGIATHSLTLYRHSNGASNSALVFGAGTVRWSWGLDNNHDVDFAFPIASTMVPDSRMKQATVNLFADMGAQPQSLQAGLVAASQTTDTIPPTSTISSPIAGSSVQSGTTVTITGTAVENIGGGVVAGVQVSTDGGVSWHPATGLAGTDPRSYTWSYTWTPSQLGLAILKSRAIDDSGNQDEGLSVAVTVTTRTCPCTIWSTSATPATASASDSTAVELGVKFKTDVAGYITGIRFYKGAGNTGTHIGNLWSSTGQNLRSATFTGETASGWQQVNFSQPVEVTANTVYVASYFAPKGGYAFNSNYFATQGTDNAPLHALQNGVSGGNGVYLEGPTGGFPINTFNSANYWVDVIFSDTAGPDVPPTVSTTTPVSGATGVSTGSTVKITFSEAMTAATVNNTTIELRDAANELVPSSVSYNPGTFTATLTPNAALASNTVYAAKVKSGSTGVKDAAGLALVSDYGWSFTTIAPAACPCTIWPTSATPAIVSDPDIAAVELGVKFKADVNGSITGIRFYKGAGNTGTHIGNLWSSTGQNLASATFTGETASGWQQVNFSQPVAVTANTVYVASYFAPSGGFSANVNYFATQGTDSVPLHALQNGVSGGNGIYVYGSTSRFPTVNSSNSANYWVDVVFSDTVGSDLPPTVSSTTPVSGATGVSTVSTVTVTFSEAMTAATINNSTIELRNAVNALVAASVNYNAGTNTATLTPNAPLANNTVYAAKVKSGTTGVTDATGNALVSDYNWSFTTAVGITPPTCPCTIWPSSATPATASASDTAPVELGVKFKTDVAGSITGIRFYKGAGNTGTHVGHLWASTGGPPLATATFSGETASGWQQVNFSSPVAVTADTVYVASYLAPNGGYSFNSNYFATQATDNVPLHALQNGVSGGNGVFFYGATGGFPTGTFNSTNYWVDVVFTTNPIADNTAPTVVSTIPSDGATDISVGPAVTINFSEAMSAASISNATIELRDAAGNLVGASVSYNPGTFIATLTPNVALATSAVYTARIKSGLTGVKDSAGNALVSDYSWSFTTSSPAIDGILPTTPTGLSASAISTSQINLTWAASTDNVGVTGYRVERCLGAACTTFGQIATPTGVSFSDTGLTATTTYRYRVRATDAAGNLSGYSAVVEATTQSPAIVSTGFLSPTANSPVTTGSGDNNGFQTSPQNAYSSDNLFALDTDSGTTNSSSSTSTGKDRHIYQNFGINIPVGTAIKGIEVRLDAKVDSLSTLGVLNTPKMFVQLSWNGGASWVTAKPTATLTTTNATYLLGAKTDTWGRAWVPNDMTNANFRVRIINVASGLLGANDRDFSLDWAAVQVTYQ